VTDPVAGTDAAVATGPDLAADVAAVRAFWTRLGLPGLLDVHTHFLPERLERRVWAQFDAAGPKIGRPWPIRYRVTADERVALLRDMGVRRFPSLPYAHRPGVAEGLNAWARDFAARVPESLWSATFFPEEPAAAYVAGLVAEGVEVFKVHVQVGEFELDDPLLAPVWGLLEDSGTPVVVHAGHAPVGNDHTGPAPLAQLLRRFPRLAVVVAHLGAPDYLAFCDLAAAHERVRLDTTMVFTDFWAGEYPGGLTDRLRDLEPKVLLGTDVPTIPYPYAHQLEALERLGLGDDWLRSVCWRNGVRLFGEARRAPGECPGTPGGCNR
jgi:predicted TIM-barrel fold metal-dependent hydrolase